MLRNTVAWPFNSIDVAVWIQLRGSSYFCISFNQRMKICNGSPPNEALSTSPYLQQTPFQWVSLGPIFICWKECESTWPELGGWRQPWCDITLNDFVPLSPCFLPFCITPICFCLLPRLFAATIRSSLRPRAKWSQSCSVSSATSTSFWRITRKVSNLCS